MGVRTSHRFGRTSADRQGTNPPLVKISGGKRDRIARSEVHQQSAATSREVAGKGDSMSYRQNGEGTSQQIQSLCHPFIGGLMWAAGGGRVAGWGFDVWRRSWECDHSQTCAHCEEPVQHHRLLNV